MKIMRLRGKLLTSVTAVFIALAVAFAVVVSEGFAVADASAKTAERLPDGGGEFRFLPHDEITDEQRAEIQAEIAASVAKLASEGGLAPASPDLVAFEWPLRKRAGIADFSIDGISNYVDQNPAFPNQLLDWNCGTRTYDQTSGYNHKGIDIFTWPFGWQKMDNDDVEIVAAAPGQIVFKSDGNYDRNCGFGQGTWNAVYIRHSDNSVAWYGHMKNGSTTTKAVGQMVAAGEKLGIVGSSGNSTGPHLHFELYNALNQLQDPFQGPCNTMNPTSWWANQEAYRVSRINRLMTHNAPPSFPTCPTTEITNERNLIRPGQTFRTAGYFRDQTGGQQTQYIILRPDNTVFTSWNHVSPGTYAASYWWWAHTMPANAPFGTWRLQATFNGETYVQEFSVGDAAVISGRVTAPDGRGLRNAIVSITDPAGVSRTVTTSSFGIYSFGGVTLDQQHTLRVASKRFRFSPETVSVNDNISNLDFAGVE